MNHRLNDTQKRIIAIMLASREMVSISSLKKLTGLNSKELKEEIARLNETLQLLNFPAEIIQVEDSYGLYLKPDEGKAVFEYLDELAKARGLSRAAMETLAVIAFKGPITRKEIMKIRGVSPDSSLATLLEYELIDRFEKDGKTYYRITKKFLRSAGLSSEKELEKLIKEAIEKETDEAS